MARAVGWVGGFGVLAATAVVAGCATSPYQAQIDTAERRLDRAEDAGVPDKRLAQVEDHMRIARRAERRADRERERATEDVVRAREHEREAHQRLQARRGRLESTIAELSASQDELQPVQREYHQLRERQLTSAEARQLVGPRLAYLQQRVSSLELARRAQELQVEMAEHEHRAARATAEAARARLDAAEQQMTLAGALYELAAEDARTLELERLTGEQERIRERLREIN